MTECHPSDSFSAPHIDIRTPKKLCRDSTARLSPSLQDYRECNPGTHYPVPENPGNPPVFKPVNPGLCAGKNPGLTGLISGVSQYSVGLHCAEKRAETEIEHLVCGKISQTIKTRDFE